MRKLKPETEDNWELHLGVEVGRLNSKLAVEDALPCRNRQEVVHCSKVALKTGEAGSNELNDCK